MTTITFSANELDELKNFYQVELDRVTKRAEDIKGILQKLSGQTPTTVLTEPKQETPKPTQRQIKSGKTKNQNVSWRTFIPRLLKKEDRYLNINDIAKFAIDKYNLPNRVKVLHTLSTTLARMTRIGVLKSTKKEGDKLNYYGLTSWTKETPVVSADKATATNGTAASAIPVSAKSNGKTKVIPWKTFIPKLIKKEGSLTIHDFVNAAMTTFNYPDKEKLLRTLSPTLTRMTKLGKLTFDRKPGQKTHLYGLPSVPAKIKAKGTAVTA